MHKTFLINLFRKYSIPQGTKDYSHFEECKKLIQCQSKLSPRIYEEMLRIAIEYTGV